LHLPQADQAPAEHVLIHLEQGGLEVSVQCRAFKNQRGAYVRADQADIAADVEGSCAHHALIDSQAVRAEPTVKRRSIEYKLLANVCADKADLAVSAEFARAVGRSFVSKHHVLTDLQTVGGQPSVERGTLQYQSVTDARALQVHRPARDEVVRADEIVVDGGAFSVEPLTQ